MPARPKVTVVGSGHVGATAAQRIVERELADVVLVDVIEGVPEGKALDMIESAPVERFDARVSGAYDYAPTAGSDIVVITAGLARKPGMSRDDLLLKNFDIVRGVVEQSIKYSPNAVLLVVTNPLDAMVHAALKVSGLPRQRVVGMAGVLDSARMRAFIALEAGVSMENTHAFVLGGHGDEMVPLPRYSTVAGVPITQLFRPEQVQRIVERTRGGGAEIVSLLKTGSAYYAPSSAVVEMVDAVLRDKNKILPCAIHLEGEYGVRGCVAGVPVRLNAGGAGEVLQISLERDEAAAFERSVQAVRDLVAKLPL
jgi:malate dehydrogenase